MTIGNASADFRIGQEWYAVILQDCPCSRDFHSSTIYTPDGLFGKKVLIPNLDFLEGEKPEEIDSDIL